MSTSNSKLKLLAAVVAAVALAGAVPSAAVYASGGHSSSQNTGTITGKVMNANGQPVAHAIVRVFGTRHMPKHGRGGPMMMGGGGGKNHWVTLHMGMTRTGSDGTFTLAGAPAGYYHIRVFKRGQGMAFVRHPMQVQAGQTADAGTLTLKKWGGPKHWKKRK